jgi:hypothetical protein
MKSKKNKTRVITILVSLLLGGWLGYLGAAVGGQAAESLPTSVIITLAVLFLPAFFFAIAVHEAGHAWAGVRMNFDFRTFVVGPLLWDKRPEGWRFMWNRNINISGGLVICIPRGTENLANRFSFYGAGGPLASLLLALAAAGLFFAGRTWGGPGVVMQGLVYTCLMLAFLSACIFLVTAIPLHSGGFYSDGARVLRFLRGGDTARFDVLLLKLVSNSMAGNRPALHSRDELQEALDLGTRLESPMTVYVSYYFYQWALDTGQPDEAERHLNNYVQRAEDVPDGMRGTVWLEAAYYYAVVRHSAEKAEEFLTLYKPSALTPLAVEYATRAALARLRGNSGEFNTWLVKAENALPHMMDRGAMQLVRERIEAMKTGS